MEIATVYGRGVNVFFGSVLNYILSLNRKFWSAPAKTKSNQMGYKMEQFGLKKFSLTFVLFSLDQNYEFLELNHYIIGKNTRSPTKKSMYKLDLYLPWPIITNY